MGPHRLVLVCWQHKNIRYKIHYVSRKYKIQSGVNVGMLVKYIYKYIQLQIHRLALVCWQPVSCDESESSPTVIKGHASLLNEVFRLRSSPFVFFSVTKFKVLDKGSIWALLSIGPIPISLFVFDLEAED